MASRRDRLWTRHIRNVLPIERQYRSALSRYFLRQRDGILRRLMASPLARMEAVKAAAEDEDILFELEEETTALRRISRPFFLRAQRRGGSVVWLEVGADGEFDAGSPASQAQLAFQLRDLARVSETTRLRVERIIVDGVANRENIQTIAKSITELYDGISSRRAKTIARTETARAYNESRHQAMRDLDVRMTEWLSARDERVRTDPFNHAIDGERRPLGEQFSNGLRFPNDPTGEPGNVVACRCVALPVVERDNEP